jgi:hypothetical protein
MIGTAEQTTWRTIAADVDGTPAPEEIGKRTEQIEARFAYKAEALEWAAGLEAAGWGEASLASAACSYYGPTDAPGNCWTMRLERVTECGCWNAVNLGSCIHTV